MFVSFCFSICSLIDSSVGFFHSLANESLSAHSAPLLLVIKSSLDHHVNSSLPAVRHVAKEALLILSIREASASYPLSSSPTSSTSPELSKTLQTYQEALKLISDPLVPVRAHGLIMLRQLVLPPTQQKKERPNQPASMTNAKLPPALVPGILDVFLQSIQDPDSYVYLNAVKGLAGLVDGWGKEVLGRMMRVYAKGVGNNGWEGMVGFGGKGKGREGLGEMERGELDLRLRVGEALCGVVERCEGSLSIYSQSVFFGVASLAPPVCLRFFLQTGSILIPPLLLVFRSSNLPTALRSSSLSILSLITNTSPLTAAPHLITLVLACADLLQIESVPMSSTPNTSKETPPVEDADEEEIPSDQLPEEDMLEASPVLSNPKHPVLRRSALYFLSAAVRADLHAEEKIEMDVWKRVARVVGYVRVTDVDLTVRGLAGEVEVDLKRVALGG